MAAVAAGSSILLPVVVPLPDSLDNLDASCLTQTYCTALHH